MAFNRNELQLRNLGIHRCTINGYKLVQYQPSQQPSGECVGEGGAPKIRRDVGEGKGKAGRAITVKRYLKSLELTARWGLLWHILRRNPDIPAQIRQ